jgi:hypothetical protein
VKGGKTPIHIQRWSPADYQADEHVRLLYARRDWRTLTFYRTFLDVAFMQGGDLPAEPEALSACLRMPVADVRKALDYCLDRLIHEEHGRLFQGRLRRDVKAELEFRESQRVRANMRWHPDGNALALPPQKSRQSPPSPSPAPAPITDNPPIPPRGGTDERSDLRTDGHGPQHGSGNGHSHKPGPRVGRRHVEDQIIAIWSNLAAIGQGQLQSHPPLDARDRVRRALREGRAPWEVAASISEQVREALVDVGAIDNSTPWPPEGWLSELDSNAVSSTP